MIRRRMQTNKTEWHSSEQVKYTILSAGTTGWGIKLTNLSGYVGMVSLCKVRLSQCQRCPGKVVVCLTARSERMRGDEIRISQSKGVRKPCDTLTC